ncbi:MAG: hypothetical protein HRT77_00725 [Halioglobus sp.]|nr:hypothetical protein [Halioglobus sp.]
MGLRLIRNSRWRWWLLPGVVLLLGACSSTTFVYNRLDFLVPWYVNDYADLNTQQDAYLDELLQPFLAWHRNQELPVYVTIIDDMASRINEPVTVDSVAAIFAEFEKAYLRLEDEALDWLLKLGGQLSEQQIDDFMTVLWEKQVELEEKYLERSDAEYHEESYENMVDNAEEYLGRLSREQQEQLLAASRRLLRSDAAWLSERAAWLEKLEVVLERKPGWEQRLRDAVVANRESLPSDYVRIYENNMEVIFAAVAELLNERSERQTKYLQSRLAELREDFETLIAQGNRSTGVTAG